MRPPSALHGARFRDRHDAGRKLGDALADLRPEQPIVVGLPRGGVVVAYEVARSLDAPLDVVVVRKLGAPFQPEYAVGAIAEGGVVLVDDGVVDAYGLTYEPSLYVADATGTVVDRLDYIFDATDLDASLSKVA